MTFTEEQLEAIRSQAVPFFMDFEGVRSVELRGDRLRIGVASKALSMQIPRSFELTPGVSVRVTVYIRTTYKVGSYIHD